MEGMPRPQWRVGSIERGMQVKRFWLLLLPLLALGGCATAPQGSVGGSECKVFERPQYVVRGARQYDQNWIDSTIEGGVGACGWARPAPRPAELDAPVSRAPQKAKAVPKKRKPAWLRMLRSLHHPKPAPVPVTPIADPAPPEPAPVAVPELPPPPPSCSPIDKLLSPASCPESQ